MQDFLEVFLVAMVKFLFAFPLALANKMHFGLSLLAASGGMMTTVSIITFFRNHLKGFVDKSYFNKRRKFSKTNRRIVKIYQKFGLWGIALATPPLLTPIGGTFVAVARGESAQRILFAMFVASIIWGLLGGGFIYFLYDIVMPPLHKYYDQIIEYFN